MGRMTLLGAVYDTVRRVRGLKGEAIHDMNHDDSRLLLWLEEQHDIKVL